MIRYANKDLLMGGIFVAIALVYGSKTYLELPMGSPVSMGPGYFPMALSILLGGIGAAVGAKGLIHPDSVPQIGRLAWRGLLAITASTLVFSLSIRGAGLILAVIATTLIAGVASRNARLIPTLCTGIVMAAFCTLVFVYLLGLQVPLIGHWFM